jgi:Xaa-Pro aminopeptidase
MTGDSTLLNNRLDRLRWALDEASVDAVALSPSDNLRHTIGFSPLADERLCILLVTASAEAFVVPQLNADQTEAAVPGLPILRWKDENGPDQALAQALASIDAARLKRVAVDPEMRAETLLAMLDAGPALRAVNGAGLMRSVREIKEPDEIDALTRSAANADEAMRRAVAACRAGTTEFEVAAAASTAFHDAGAEEPWICVGSGPNGAFPHHEVSRRVMQEGDPVVIDLGAKLDSYASDLTRMVFVGEPSARYREVHETVEAAVQAALAAARPGATCGDVDQAARRVIEDAGYGERFLHRTGHGLGLSTHEAPWIMADDPTPLRPGMVFSIEPGIYLDRDFGVRLEEIVQLTEAGPSIFSGLPRTVHPVPA